MKSLSKILHKKAERLKKTAHLIEQRDCREHTSQSNKAKSSDKAKTSVQPDKKPVARKRCEGCNNDPQRQKEKNALQKPDDASILSLPTSTSQDNG